MCGICGIYNYKNQEPVDPHQVIKMYKTMKYRGPDDEGYYTEESLALGHCRLSILDTSSRGKQPMSNEDGSIVITYNGEVYNYLELREMLISKGYCFKTGTDTEVIIQMYKEFGVKCLQYFIGMFAFAIWDKNEKKLFMVRDRLGIKPFYYLETKEGLMFSSEIKAITATMGSRPSVSHTALDCYMSFGYVPGEETTFQGIKKLMAGHYMVIKNNRPNIEQYWDVDFQEEPDKGESYYVEALREKLLDASRLRLRSDVPLGVFLSGGIDSSAVVALLSSELTEPIKTFSVAYDKGSDFNETSYARIVAKKYNTDHYEFFVSPDEFRDFIPKFVWHMDEPVIEAAAISLYFIAKLAKEFVTVVLSGEGSDEMFAGYPIYYYMKVIDQYRRLPESVREKVLNPVFRKFGNEKLRKYIQLSRYPLANRYLGVPLYDIRKKESIYTEDFRKTLNGYSIQDLIQPYYEGSKGQDKLNQMLYLDIKTWLVDDLLIKADKMSMAPSLELRVPFLDHRIAEFAAKMPVKYKLKGRTTKYILKKAMEGILPREIIYRSKKGFPTPLQTMFQHELKEYARQLLTEKRTIDRGYFKPSIVSKMLEEHALGQADHHKIIWQLVVLEEWHRCFIDI